MIPSQTQQTVFAGSGNRVAALCLDLFLLAILSLMVPEAAEQVGRYVFPALFFLYFAGMPLTPLQGTLGKWICRIKISDRQGNKLNWRAAAVRAITTLCWFSLPFVFGAVSAGYGSAGQTASEIWLLVFALPWAFIGFMPRQESLFDLAASSLVVRCKADTESIAAAAPIQKHPIRNGIGIVLFCLISGFLLQIAVQMQLVRGMHGRVAYAIGETLTLRSNIEAFYAAEQRWPTAKELGIPDWNPYPDGGGYGLKENGTIVITFSVLPELKGHSIRFTPNQPAGKDKRINWQCSVDAGLDKRFVPWSCR